MSSVFRRPVPTCVLGGQQEPRVFANKALSFTQAIPYGEGRKPDKYRRPLSMIGRNKGDCDSKQSCFCAMHKLPANASGSGVHSTRFRRHRNEPQRGASASAQVVNSGWR